MIGGGVVAVGGGGIKGKVLEAVKVMVDGGTTVVVGGWDEEDELVKGGVVRMV